MKNVKKSEKKDSIDLINSKKEVIYNKNSNDISNKKLRFVFNSNFFTLLITFLICAISSFLLIMMSFSIMNERTIDYQEKSNIDYRVYLKENEFYDEEYLEEDMVYVSTLIKNIETNFKYDFNINEKSNIKFDYAIVGNLLITDVNGSKTFFEKEYTLLESKSQNLESGNSLNIDETIKINYSYYNDLANRYRQQYGVNSQSYFIVSLKVYKTSVDDVLQLNNDSVMSIKIPLAENEVNIKIDSNELNNNSNVISKAILKISNLYYFIPGIIISIISILLFVKLLKYVLKRIPKRSKYDKTLAKILKEYDRFIVETTTAPTADNLKIINVEKFIELLDVRDNLSQPIKYYNIVSHKKCVFYINYDNEIYIYALKESDLDKNS